MKKGKQIQRREFLNLLGKGTLTSIFLPQFFYGCNNGSENLTAASLSANENESIKDFILKGIDPSNADDVQLAEGLTHQVLLKWNDPISDIDRFGFNNDFTCFIPIDKNAENDGLLWVNHEYSSRLFVSNYFFPNERTIEQVDKEMYSVGGSIVRVKEINGKWEVVKNDPLNRRITAKTNIPFNWDYPIKGSNKAMGTHSNCSGGITPWGTILTCEENYDSFYGETLYDASNNPTHIPSSYGWENFYPNPPEHYGWVVEVDPFTGKGQKHIALGRFSHECCTLVQLPDNRIVAYTGDDMNNEFIYKFISSKPNSLKEGTLYVADTINGVWIPIDFASQSLLQARFKNQTDVLIRTREAARILGATPQNRPEDIEIDPLTGNVIISLTNNSATGDFHGTILKLSEFEGKHDALSFTSEALATGGHESGFTCPDNLVFDLSGNLWFTSDISGALMNQQMGPYFPTFKNNGLYVLLRHGKDKGKIIQIASAPTDAEFTGPWFSPDYKTLFLSVQHPGERSMSLNALTSTWPHDKDGIPKPSVIVIKGAMLDKLNHLREEQD